MGKRINLEGVVQGRLTVLKLYGLGKRKRKLWLCSCSCGGRTVLETHAVTSGKTRSCGCLHKQSVGDRVRLHGMSSSPEYVIWCGMKSRCYTKSATGYSNYGGRGITVCERWHKFENFLSDMGERPKGMSIDRIDNEGDYEPSNCRWATNLGQSRNSSRNRTIILNGKEFLARDVAEANGVSISAFKARLYKYKWSLERACGAAK